MPKTYELVINPGTNSGKPLIFIEETDGAGAKLEDAGQNIMMAGQFDCKFRPNSLSIDFFTVSGKSLSLVYAQIDSYEIFSTSTGLTTAYAVWNKIKTELLTNANL
ncbi:MAG: hypothetical protein [Bacteriophage sp.]|nr:MAG: hypothetical protein [Bacteriophage sp.]